MQALLVKLHEVESHSRPADLEKLTVMTDNPVGWRISEAGQSLWSGKTFEGATGQNRGLSEHSGSCG
jgi:hypothetical protein